MKTCEINKNTSCDGYLIAKQFDMTNVIAGRKVLFSVSFGCWKSNGGFNQWRGMQSMETR